MNDTVHAARMLALEHDLSNLVGKYADWLDGPAWAYACQAVGLGYFESYAEASPRTSHVLERLHGQIKREWKSQTLDEAKVKLRQLDLNRTETKYLDDGSVVMTVYSNLNESLKFCFHRSELG